MATVPARKPLTLGTLGVLGYVVNIKGWLKGYLMAVNKKRLEIGYKVKIRPYLTREGILEDINTLILLARDNNFSVLEKELVELEEELKIE